MSKEENIVEIFVSKIDGEFRIDPHPAWDKTGRYVIFKGYINNTRNVLWPISANGFSSKVFL